MNNIVLIKYSEIHLKGLNRPYFEKALVNAIKKSLSSISCNVIREQGRIYIKDFDDIKLDTIVEKSSKVFGVHSVSPAICVEKTWDAIRNASIDSMNDLLRTMEEPTSFKVFAKRSDKQFPMKSEEICRELGHEILENCSNVYVDVHNPHIKLEIEIRDSFAYIYSKEFKGVGGMPIGTGGKAMLLLSGGIDSPVAGYMISKRGVRIEAIHFYSYPYTSERAKNKVIDLAKLLSEYTEGIRLHLVPFTDIQLTIYDNCPSSETTLIMRRLMMKISERVALKNGCQALITGESIGQVASQTIEALNVTDNMVKNIPVFRPLIGFDKDDIIEIAKKIETFDTSILPFEDCCTVFVPKHPVTKPSLEKIIESESKIDFEPLVNKAIEEIETIDIYS